MTPDESSSTPKSRSRRKTAVQQPTISAPPAPASAAVDSPSKNVGPMESLLSLFGGTLFVIAALFPRSIKQMLLLALGGGLVYRGLTSQCSFYKAIGFDTTKDSLLNQISDRYASTAEHSTH